MEFSALTTSKKILSIPCLSWIAHVSHWLEAPAGPTTITANFLNACSLDSFCPLLLRNHLKRQDAKEIRGLSAQLKDLNPIVWNEKNMQNFQKTRWKWYRIPPPTCDLRIETPPKSFLQNLKGRKCSKVDPNKCSPACHIPWHFVVFWRKVITESDGIGKGDKAIQWFSADGGGLQTFWRIQHAHLQVRFLYWRVPDSKIGS